MKNKKDTMLFRQALGRVISDHRYDNGLTLRQTTNRGSGRISYNYLWELEQGHKEASSEMLEEIAECLGITTAELVIRVGLLMGGGVPNTPEEILDTYTEPMVVSK
jgi:transcriptional regulator with XRE-family HTH domain